MTPDDPSSQTPGEAGAASPGRGFAQTSWTQIAAAGGQDSPQAREALATLCQTYWEPLHAYLLRLGYADHDAKDLTQEFFLLLLSRNFLGAADRKKGKFRSFLLTAFRRFLIDERRKSSAAKRGSGQAVVSLDETTEDGQPRHEPAGELSPVTVFEQRWARTVFQQTFAQLRVACEAEGKAALFDQLHGFLEGVTSARDYAPVAAQLHMTPNAVGVAVHRLRRRFGEVLRAEVARTLANPTAAEIDAEMQHLHRVLAG